MLQPQDDKKKKGTAQDLFGPGPTIQEATQGRATDLFQQQNRGSAQDLFPDQSAPVLPTPAPQRVVQDQWWRDPQSRQEIVNNPNVRAFLDVVAEAEGTFGGQRAIGREQSYSIGFNYTPIDSLREHPELAHKFTDTAGKKNVTTAAGRYQFIGSTWNSLRELMSLPDFGPQSQDLAALELARQEGALPHILAGDIRSAVQAVNARSTQWASLPSARAAQPKRDWDFVTDSFNRYVLEHTGGNVKEAQQAIIEPDNDYNILTDPWMTGVKAAAEGGAVALKFFSHIGQQAAQLYGFTVEPDVKTQQQVARLRAWGERGVDPVPQNIANMPWYHPYTAYRTVAENLPLMAGLVAGSMVHPALGAALMTGVEGGSALQEMENWEATTGQQVDPAQKNTTILTVGAFNAALEFTGISQILKVGKVPGLRGKLIQLAIAAGTEGTTEAGQEIVQALGESGYLGHIPDDLGERLIHSFYAGALLGIAGGTVDAGLARLGRELPPDAVFEDTVDPGTGQLLEPRFRILKGGHRLEGQVVSAQEAADAGLQLPAYRRELVKKQMLHAVPNLGEVRAEASMVILDNRARLMGISIEELLSRALRGVVSGVAADPNDLKQDVGPIWYSQMHRVLEKAGLPKKGKARDYLAQIEKLQKAGKFKADELEWSGVKEFVSLMEDIEALDPTGEVMSSVVARDELLERIANGGVKLREIFTRDVPGARRIKQATFLYIGSDLVTSQKFYQFLKDTYGEHHVLRESREWLPEAQNPDGSIVWRHEFNRGAVTLPQGQSPAPLSLIEEHMNTNPTPEEIESWGVSPENVERYRSLEEYATYSDYSIPGARNFKELVLSWDTKETNIRESSIHQHFPFIRNPLAFVLMSDRRADQQKIDTETGINIHLKPSKVLLLEQIQSDWHQKGRKFGYINREEMVDLRIAYQEAVERYAQVERETRTRGVGIQSLVGSIVGSRDLTWHEITPIVRYVTGRETTVSTKLQEVLNKLSEKKREQIEAVRNYVRLSEEFSKVARKLPPAPFSDSWVDLTLKRMVRYAAENGYEYVAIPTADMVTKATGGQPEGQKEFYESIVPSRIKKITKQNTERITLGNPDRGDYRFSRLPSPNEYEVQAIRMTPELVDQALQGYPLFQGSKGAIGFAQDGTALIKALTSPDVSTMLHEIGHLFRRTLSVQELERAARAFGIKDPNNWTRSEEEHFARAWERWFYEGRTPKNLAGMRGLFRQFREWLVDIYGEIAGSDIDVPLTKNMRKFFASIIADSMPVESTIEEGRSRFEKFADWFDVENRFRRIGQAETGFRIKNFYSEQERHIDEARRLTMNISRWLGRDQGKISDLVLAAESEALSAKIMQSGDKNMIKALVALRDYFDRSLNEYKSAGAINKGFKELLLDSLNERIHGILGRKKLGQKEIQQLTDLVNQLDLAKDIQFVHIPLTFWFDAYAAQNPAGARASLAVLKERKTPRIQDLIDRGIITKEDIKLGDILLSYGSRKGKDMGFLHIRNAAIREGAARRKAPGAPNSYGYVSAPLKASFMKGYEMNRPMSDWIQSLLQTDRYSKVRDWINTTKMGAFWNPLLLNTYNLIQLTLAMPITRIAQPQYVLRAWDAVHNRTESFYEAEENGVSSQPFVSPLEDLQLKFAQAEEGPVIANLRNVFANSKDDLFTGLAKAPFRMLKTLYQASWDSAWWFDRVSRQVLYEYLKEQGQAPREAAQFTARVFGDYASVPFHNRRALNTVLFTPTYKIAMGKLYYDGIRGLGSLFKGDNSQSSRMRAGILIRTTAWVVGFHLFMKALGWEDDQFGRRYYKTVVADPSIQPEAGIGAKELVFVFGGPHDLFYKMFLRITDSFKPEVENPLERWFGSQKFEIQPIFRVISDVVQNKGTGGGPIYYVTDSAEIKGWKMFKYGLSQLVPMLSAIAELDPSQGMRAIVEENQLSPQGAALFEQEYGNFRKVITGEYRITPELFGSKVGFVYARDITPIRVREQVQRMQLILEQEIGARAIKDAIMRGETTEELNERIETIGPRVENVIGRINKILERLEDYHYEAPVDTYIHEPVKGTADSLFAQ